ncbi:MAG: Na+/H+ antiporter subunit D [Acidimicrobiia bacterium]
MRALVPAPVCIPLIAAAVALLLQRKLDLQRAASIAGLVATLAVSLWILASVYRSGPIAAHLGGWPAPVGIVLVADLYSSLLVLVSSITVTVVLIYAIGQLSFSLESRFFHPLYLVLTAGVTASFLTADLFNLFVAYEVTLIASYALLTLGGMGVQVRPALTYVVVNLFASILFLTGVSFVYASLGTVNMADLSQKAASLDPPLRMALAFVFLVVFGIKAAVFPLYFWLPDSYPTAPTSITAVFAGLLTKIGVYSLIRQFTLVFGVKGTLRDVLLAVAGLTMVIGVLGAIAQDDIKRVLSFQIISHVGFIVLGLAIASVGSLAAGIFYTIHHIPVITSLFLIGGNVEKVTGTGALPKLGGMARRMPASAILFLIGGASLAGVPPSSGFFGKLGLIQSGISDRTYLLVAIALLTSFLTLFSVFKVWGGVFWGEPDEPPPIASSHGAAKLYVPRLMTAATTALVVVVVGIAIGVEPLYRLCARAAENLIEPSQYIAAVMGRHP